jgi:hypothetical protein
MRITKNGKHLITALEPKHLEFALACVEYVREKEEAKLYYNNKLFIETINLIRGMIDFINEKETDNDDTKAITGD